MIIKNFGQDILIFMKYLQEEVKKTDLVYRTIEKNIYNQLNFNMKVLELAAGPGIMSPKIAAACKTLEVTDFSEEMIKKAKKKNMPDNVNFAVADATDLKYENSSYIL